MVARYKDYHTVIREIVLTLHHCGGIMGTLQIIKKYFEEDDETFLTGLYRELLNRTPDNDGFLYHMDSLKKNGMKIEVFRKMVKSKEFSILLSQSKIIQVFQKIMYRNDYDFVKQLYHNIFGTVPKLSQMQIDTEKLRNNTKTKVGLLQNLLLSEEMLTQLNSPPTSNFPEFSVLNRLINVLQLDRNECVNELYCELFDGNLEQNEFINHPGLIEKNSKLSEVEVYKAFINSSEFTNQFNNHSSLNCLKMIQGIMKLPDEEFLFEAYRECLDREPDSWGYKYYIQHLKNGIKRIEIITEILSSDEAREKLNSTIENKDKSLQNIESNHSPSQLRKDMETLLKKHNLPFETNIIFKFGGLGDFIQMTPVAKALKTKYPGYPVVAAIVGAFGAYGYFSSILDDHPYIDVTIECRDMVYLLVMLKRV